MYHTFVVPLRRNSARLFAGGDVINYGGGGSGQARVKTNTIDWDDDWSE